MGTMTIEEFNNAVEKISSLCVATTNTTTETTQKMKPLSEIPTITLKTDDIHILWDTKPIQQEITMPMNNEQFETAKRAFQVEYKSIYRKTINRVIFNEPATIVFWGNGEKTVSKCYDEQYNKKKGLLMCIAKAHGCTHSHIKAVLKRRGLKDSQDAELCLLYDIADRNGYFANDIDNIVEKYTLKEEEK